MYSDSSSLQPRMTHKVVMRDLRVTADDHFMRHDERRDLRVLCSARESPRGTLLSAQSQQCQSFALAASPGLLVAPVARKLLLNFKRICATSSSTKGKRLALLRTVCRES